ncbi:MAG: nucleoside kinase, partial [Lachnospiraceae bacterium]|nr:nucleoside kinase [Lachnospiraceae bacterium]
VRKFHVEAYSGGLMLVLPTEDNPDVVEEFRDSRHLFETLKLSQDWGDLVDIANVGDLNERICQGSINDMILVQEALQERRIGEIAGMINDRENVKFVLIAGPSSSGKTTFAHRLAIQLRSFGLKPHIISLDNYFVNREKTPVDIDGNYDFDCLEAIDLELFNDDMNDLLDGEEVELPTFNFKAGKREYKGRKMKLHDDDILIIEGIHCLNPKTTEELPDENKFKIYTSALTTLNIDDHNRIPTTDARLLRRMVRDSWLRGYDARQTLNIWKSVREGEEQYIFPYQEDADTVFNSVLIYELSVIKQYAEPLLFNVKKGEPEYYEAKRLLKFLDYFVGVDTAAVPKNSLCREFVGGGGFQL